MKLFMQVLFENKLCTFLYKIPKSYLKWFQCNTVIFDLLINKKILHILSRFKIVNKLKEDFSVSLHYFLLQLHLHNVMQQFTIDCKVVYN